MVGTSQHGGFAGSKRGRTAGEQLSVESNAFEFRQDQTWQTGYVHSGRPTDLAVRWGGRSLTGAFEKSEPGHAAILDSWHSRPKSRPKSFHLGRDDGGVRGHLRILLASSANRWARTGEAYERAPATPPQPGLQVSAPQHPDRAQSGARGTDTASLQPCIGTERRRQAK